MTRGDFGRGPLRPLGGERGETSQPPSAGQRVKPSTEGARHVLAGCTRSQHVSLFLALFLFPLLLPLILYLSLSLSLLSSLSLSAIPQPRLCALHAPACLQATPTLVLDRPLFALGTLPAWTRSQRRRRSGRSRAGSTGSCRSKGCKAVLRMLPRFDCLQMCLESCCGLGFRCAASVQLASTPAQ